MSAVSTKRYFNAVSLPDISGGASSPALSTDSPWDLGQVTPSQLSVSRCVHFVGRDLMFSIVTTVKNTVLNPGNLLREILNVPITQKNGNYVKW